MEPHPNDRQNVVNQSSISSEDQLSYIGDDQRSPFQLFDDYEQQRQLVPPYTRERAPPYIQQPIPIQQEIDTMKEYTQVFQQSQDRPRASYRVIFPFKKIYKPQKDYIRKVLEALHYQRNALLESPTGTGKTICLLAGGLAYQSKKILDRVNPQENREEQQLPLKIVYLTRTHIQLQQVQQELAKTPYRPKMAIFSSRDQLCVKIFPQGTDKNTGCQEALNMNHYFKKALTQPTPQQYQKMCFYSKQELDIHSIANQYRGQVFTTETIKQKALEKRFCPYYYPYKLNGADIYFMPYNYVLTSSMMKLYKKYLKSAIFIFDQGHNIPDVATRGRDLHFQTTEFRQVINQIRINQRLTRFPSQQQLQIIKDQRKWNDLKCQLNEVHSNFQRYVNDLKSQPGTFKEKQKSQTGNNYRYSYFVGQDMIPQLRKMFTKKYDNVQLTQARKDIKEFLLKFVISNGNLKLLIKMLYKVVDQKSKHMKKISSTFQRFYWLIINSSPENLRDLEQNDIQINHYILVIKARQKTQKSDEVDVSNFVVELVCNTPILTIKALQRIFTPRSIIITSGTLKPLPLWTQQLGIKFQTNLQNKHLIKNYQLNVRIVPKSAKPSDEKVTPFNFSYYKVKQDEALEDPILFKNLTISINRLLPTITGGVLIVLPNKTYLKTCVTLLRDLVKRKEFLCSKHIFSEKDDKKPSLILQDYKQKAKTEDGAVLCCVFRGRISEGTDLPDEECRAVIIVGMPNLDTSAPTIFFKKLYLKRMEMIRNGPIASITYEKWYQQQTARAVNQAIGRVIRKKEDYGAVFLLDSKYHHHRDWFPDWVSRSIQGPQFSFSKICIATQIFFDTVKAKIDRDDPQETEKQSQIQQPNPRRANRARAPRGGSRPPRVQMLPNQEGRHRPSRVQGSPNQEESRPHRVQMSPNEDQEEMNGRKIIKKS